MNRRNMLSMIAAAPALALPIPKPTRPDLGGLRFTDKELELIYDGFLFAEQEDPDDPEAVHRHVLALQRIWVKLLNFAEDFYSPTVRAMTAEIEDYEELYASHYVDRAWLDERVAAFEAEEERKKEETKKHMASIERETTKLREISLEMRRLNNFEHYTL